MKAPLVLLTALFIASAHQTLSGEAFGDWTYSVSGSQATITGYSGVGGAVDIPSVVNEISVVKVGDGYPPIFGSNNTTVTSVTIPDSVTSIGIAAFASCTSLASITIPDSVTSIGVDAFLDCTSLESITIPDNVTSIGGFAFYACTSLTSITIGNSVESIGYFTFGNCPKLTSLTIGNSVTSIEDAAFIACTSLSSVTIPDSVTSIGIAVFYSCTSLASITIPDSVTSIGDQAFQSCISLTSVTIPDSVTSIGGDAFYGCTSLTSVTLPILFSDSYPSFSLSSEQVLLYGSPVARDVPLSNSFAAGQQDVTASPSAYDLHTSTELAEATAAARTIVNVSARVNIGADETVIPGFVVLGESKQLLIRAVGPKLADLNVPSPLPDPTMTIYQSRFDGNPPDEVATIDDWKEGGADVAAINAAMTTAGAFPLEPTDDFQGNALPTDDTKSAATLVTLSEGVYTVVVTSADGSQGEVLVEVYEIIE